MDELALIAVGADARGGLVPLLAHFGLVILVDVPRPLIKLVVAMGIGALLAKLAVAEIYPVLAKFGLIVDFKVGNVSHHFLTRTEVHLLLFTLGIEFHASL